MNTSELQKGGDQKVSVPDFQQRKVLNKTKPILTGGFNSSEEMHLSWIF